jgi:hypothetical protein
MIKGAAMTRKELVDAIFKVSVILIMIAAFFVYYENSQASRYQFKTSDNGHYVFDSRSGNLYMYITGKKGEKSGWGFYPLCETPQVKPVGDFEKMK